jgi:anti-anti-sigma factor
MQVSPPAVVDGGSMADSPANRCEFGKAFDQLTVDCPAFQPRAFVAATSYGKPLGTHVACAHLLVGEIGHNQFYPRCALGSARERVRWVANVGPGRIEVSRALQAEFGPWFTDFHRRLINAKAAVLAAPAGHVAAARAALATTVREFLLAFESVVAAEAARIEELGIAPATVTTMAAQALAEWQRSRRLEFPATDSTWMGRPALAERVPAVDMVRTPNLVVTRSMQPPVIKVIGQIDASNMLLLESALSEALRAETALVAVDLSGVTFCSVAGIRVLVRAVETGAALVSAAPAHIRRAFDAAGFDAIVESPEAVG